MSAPRSFDVVDIDAEIDRLQDAVNTACEAACRVGVPADLAAYAVGSLAARRAFLLAGGDGLDSFVSVVRGCATEETLWEDGPARPSGPAGTAVQ